MSEQQSGWKAAARMHQALFTGLLLRILMENGEEAGAAFLHETFKAQHDEKFLAALPALGLSGKPDAVACAQFFYLANKVGGVHVECMVESERKAWIRYPPPRWAYMDAAVCAVPDSVTIGMLRGFHARCGESLGNPRLGFVCTGTTTNGEPGLEGYFIEEDRSLGADERLRFARDERGPRFDPGAAPMIDWDDERLTKAERNYALNYIRQMLPAMRRVVGDDAGAAIAGCAARLVGMQLYRETAALTGRGDSQGFAVYLAAMLEACGDRVERLDASTVRQTGWRMMAGQSTASALDFGVWAELWRGAAAVAGAGLAMNIATDTGSPAPAAPTFGANWTVTG